MENLFSPLSTNTANTTITTTNASKPKMGYSQNSPFSSIYGPLSYPSTSSNSSTQSNYQCPPEYNMPIPIQSLQFPQVYPPPSPCPLYPLRFLQNGIEIQKSCLLQPNGSSIDQERRALDAYKTKVARSKRKLARQRSLSKNSSSGFNSTQGDTKRLTFNVAGTNAQDSQSTINKDLFKFCTPDNKRLRVLLRKELKNSDVGSLGRIVLPKREAEENLPILSDKEGIQFVIRNVYSNKEWSLKFKYWSNNKSRMYVLENTGDFVKQNGLEIGDSLTLYEDESKKLYFSIKKVETIEAEPSTSQNYIHIPHTYQAKDEEEASLALLIEQLEHKEQQEEANSLVTLSMDIGPYRPKEEEKTSSFNNVTSISIYPQPAAAAAAAAMQNSNLAHSTMRLVDDHYNIDDCYTGLGVLPDFNRKFF